MKTSRWGVSWDERNGGSWAWGNPFNGSRTEAEIQRSREQEQSRMDVETWIKSQRNSEAGFGSAYVKACLVGSRAGQIEKKA